MCGIREENMNEKQKWLGNMLGKGESFAYGLWSKQGLAPTLTTMDGGEATFYNQQGRRNNEFIKSKRMQDGK